MGCVFCKIVEGKLPAEILHESDRVMAILDINPIHFGHALVIPKRHYLDFLSVSENDFHALMSTTQIVAHAMVNCLELEGFNIFSNNGKVAGQSVFHFHMHITPRYEDDNIKFVLQLKTYPEGELAAYGRRIREYIRPQLPQHSEGT